MERDLEGMHLEYKAVALYYEDADFVEYVLKDVPCVYRRIDEMLTVALDMRTREPIGFRLKGFRNFYLNEIKPMHEKLGGIEFVNLVSVLEHWVDKLGADVFADEIKRMAYKRAYQIARGVVLEELPHAA